MIFNTYKDNDTDKSGDYSYMVGLVMENYTNYFKASHYLQRSYDFSLQAIYSCLSKVNNLDNRLLAYRELSKFLRDLKKKSGLDMKIVSKSKLYVREKVKIKRGRRIGLYY